MTTTTAKRRARAAALPRLAPLAAAMLLAAPAHADWRLVPTLGLSTTYTDNVNLQNDALARSETVAQVTPGLSVVGAGRRLNVSATAQWHQFAFLQGSGRRTNDNQRQYSGALKGELADELLYIDASASRGQRSASAFGPQLSNDLYALGNRVEVETWSVSPYLVHRFGHDATMQLRYTRDAVDAGSRDGAGIGFRNSDSDTVSASLASGPSFSDLGWGLNYYRQELETSRLGQSSSETLGANLSYRLGPRLALTANLGYDRYDFEGLGGTDAGRNWSAGFAWNPSARTSLQASLGRHYYGQTGSLAASHRSRYTIWSLNYGDSITTSRQQFLLPATIDTAALLDRLFSAAYPDPVERERVVAAYMAATGLPPSLADNVNYLSNRYMRQKLLQGSMAYRRSHSAIVFSLYASERTALSDQQSDSELLGSQLATLNNNVRQRGLNGTYSYRLSSRSNLVAAFSLSRTESLTSAVESRQRMLRLGVTRRYGERLLGALELRRRSGDVGTGSGGQLQEHAISASLSMQL